MVFRTAVLLIVASAVPAFAQDSTTTQDSLPFRRGQWAAHFFLGSFSGIGVSRFSTPTRALVVQLNVDAIHGEAISGSGTTRAVSVQSGATVSARLGWRSYRAGRRSITPYTTFGPTFTLSHYYSSSPSGSSSFDGWALGAFAELGALYHVTSSLALGAHGSTTLRYSRDVQRSTGGPTVHFWDMRLSGVSVAAGVTLMF